MKGNNTAEEKDSVIAMANFSLLCFILFASRVCLYLALTLSVLSVISSPATHWLHRIWKFITEILGRISGTIILTFVFLCILTPTAILKKWFGKKDMILQQGGIRSTFQDRNHEYTAHDFKNPW
jgi:hypothetical protein